MSLVWAGAVVTRAKKEGRIKDDFSFQTIIREINDFRRGCSNLLCYDWIPIPLVYTQESKDLISLAFCQAQVQVKVRLGPAKRLNFRPGSKLYNIFGFAYRLQLLLKLILQFLLKPGPSQLSLRNPNLLISSSKLTEPKILNLVSFIH